MPTTPPTTGSIVEPSPHHFAHRAVSVKNRNTVARRARISIVRSSENLLMPCSSSNLTTVKAESREVAQLIHPTAIIDANAHVGADTRIWHFTHVMPGAYIGNRCTVGQGCFIGKVRIGHGCKIQNNVSIYDGVTLEDDVFLGPSCVFTNVAHPRAHVSRKAEFQRTL